MKWKERKGSRREIVRGTARLINEQAGISGRNFDSARIREEERGEVVNDKERLMNERWKQNIWRGTGLRNS